MTRLHPTTTSPPHSPTTAANHMATPSPPSLSPSPQPSPPSTSTASPITRPNADTSPTTPPSPPTSHTTNPQTDAQSHTETLLQKFQTACLQTPLPNLKPANLPNVPPRLNAYIARTPTGDIRLARHALSAIVSSQSQSNSHSPRSSDSSKSASSSRTSTAGLVDSRQRRDDTAVDARGDEADLADAMRIALLQAAKEGGLDVADEIWQRRVSEPTTPPCLMREDNLSTDKLSNSHSHMDAIDNDDNHHTDDRNDNDDDDDDGTGPDEDANVHGGVTDQTSTATESLHQSRTHSHSQSQSLLEMLGKERFTPLPALFNFDWESSSANKTLRAFREQAKPPPPKPPTPPPSPPPSKTPTARRRPAPPSRLAATHSTPSRSPPTTTTTSSPSTPSRPRLLSRANSTSRHHSIRSATQGDNKPVDTVVLAAQQEAVASSMLKDIRAAHARLRKSGNVPPLRQGDTPLWALLAHRGGKLKPEAAAEMARARVAAAAAAAVMRDAAAEAEAEEGGKSHANGDKKGVGSSNRGNGLGGESDTSTATSVSPTRPQAPLPLVQLPEHVHDHDNDFLNEYISPCVRPSGKPSDAVLYRHPVQPPPPPSSIDTSNVRASKPLNKKRVMFAEGTVFHMKK